MATTGKMSYTESDEALTASYVLFTFSIDGTIVTPPNAIVIRNDESAGTGKNVSVALNSGSTEVAVLEPGQRLSYSIKKVKQLKLKYTGSGAPSYSVSGVL